MGSQYARSLSDFAGIAGGELLDAENLYRDYAREGAPIVTVPGYALRGSYSGELNGIHPFGRVVLNGTVYEETVLVHAGGTLFLEDHAGERLAQSAEGAVADAKSAAYRYGGRFVLLDGEGFWSVSAVYREYDEETGTPGHCALDVYATVGYVPVTVRDGVRYENENLLADEGYEEITISDPTVYDAGSDHLLYRRRDGTIDEAEVYLGADATGIVVIPQTTKIAGNTLRVTQIAKGAFQGNTAITELIVMGSVKEIGRNAFAGCSSLIRITVGGEVKSIRYGAFRSCTALQTVSLGENVASISANAFAGDGALAEVRYAGADFAEVSIAPIGNSHLTRLTPICDADVSGGASGTLRLPLSHPTHRIVSLRIGGSYVSVRPSEAFTYSLETENGLVVAVKVHALDRRALYGKRASIQFGLSARDLGSAGRAGILSHYPGYTGEAGEAVRRARCCALYDGRVFVSGCRDLPGAVFFSAFSVKGEPHAGYFGHYNYFIAGEGQGEVVALVPAPDALYVITREREMCGIYRYLPREGSGLVSRVYERTDGHCVEGKPFGAMLYRGRCHVVTDRAVLRISEGLLDREGTLRDVSAGIAGLARLSPVAITEYEGYFALLEDTGRLWLGDGRETVSTANGSRYAWWRTSPLGGYEGDEILYRYRGTVSPSDTAHGILPAPPALAEGVVSGAVFSEGESMFTEEDGVRLGVYDSGERVGGRRVTPTLLVRDGERLLFGGGDGRVYCTMNDRRGIPSFAERSTMSERELADFAEAAPAYLAPEVYRFAGHGIACFLLTCFDDAGARGYAKSTRAKSTVLECASLGSGSFAVSAVTDRGMRSHSEGLFAGELDFALLNFEHICFGAGEGGTTVFREKTRRWHTKQYLISSEGVGNPISPRGITYLYEYVGKVKQS